MELLINITKWQYEAVKNGKFDIGIQTNILFSVIYGIPLPKGHGRLIDENKLLENLKESANHHANNSREESLLYRDRVIVREQPTIIEADKEE